MKKRIDKGENTRSEKNNCNPEDLNDLQNKIVNKNESDNNKINTDGPSALNINVDQGPDDKSYHKDGVATSSEGTSGSLSRMRRRSKPVSYCPPQTPAPESQPSLSAKKINVDQDTDEKGFQKESVVTSAPGTSGSLSRTRQRNKPISYCPPRTPSPDSRPSSSAKKMKIKKASLLKNDKSTNIDEVEDQSRDSIITNPCLKDSSDDENDESNKNKTAFSAAIALDKLKFNIKIDPNVEDRYTDSGFTAEGSTPESPETRRQRIDIISRQCRLHPANKKYNQGPVGNPPLITPGKMVGYTPGGQRHEVDLNFDRPTSFNSEYARMQWDYATKVNVSRMFHDLETGMFLADGLDPNIERRHFAEQDMATEQATEHFEQIANASSSRANGQSTSQDLSEEEKEYLKLLDAENELIELNKFAVVRLHDFAGEVDRKLRKALDLPLTPLMIKKNPVILDTLETLARQCIHIEVVLAARALLTKIKGLFQVPENQEFREFFAAEVEKLKEKTKDMSGFDILMMVEEPPSESSNSDDPPSVAETLPASSESEENQDSNKSDDEWVPVENGDVWVDLIPDPNNVGNHFETNVSSTSGFYEASEDSDDEDDEWTIYDEYEDSLSDENEDSLSDEIDSDDDLDDQLDEFVGTLISEE